MKDAESVLSILSVEVIEMQHLQRLEIFWVRTQVVGNKNLNKK